MQPALCIDLLEYRLLDSTVRHDARARAIVFDVIGPDGTECWTFDPRSRGRLFSRCDLPGAALRVRCTSDMLFRLTTDPSFAVQPADRLRCEGDISLLSVLADSLPSPRRALDVRMESSR